MGRRCKPESRGLDKKPVEYRDVSIVKYNARGTNFG